MEGYRIVARAFAQQGIGFAFGVVGIPVIELATAMQSEGIVYIGMRNEQAASYGASAIGYLTQRPAICLVVSGPGLIHALAGLSNAFVNGWPLIVVGGSCETSQLGMGAFQEWPQVEAVRPYTKLAVQPSSLVQVASCVERAIRISVSGRPGPVYIDLPSDLLYSYIDEAQLPAPPSVLAIPEDLPKFVPDPRAIQSTVRLLCSAKRPLVIIGKGCANSSIPIRSLIDSTGLPFLPTPMGKGVVSDLHRCCVASARTKALKTADVIVLMGARLNWILHFGLPPRFAANVKIIQVDICAEEIGNNVKPAVAVCADAGTFAEMLLTALLNARFHFDPTCSWWRDLNEASAVNRSQVEQMSRLSPAIPLNYYSAYSVIERFLPQDAIIVNEGANTMDIGRTMMPNRFPKSRLDAGSFGTMGVGLGFAIAAAVLEQQKTTPGRRRRRIFCIQGDSAFGFGAMELETVSRYRLPITVIILNNNGIYSGLDEESWQQIESKFDTPVTSLTPGARYEQMGEMFGGRGVVVRNGAQLEDALQIAADCNGRDQFSVINILIDPFAQKKPQEHFWLTSKM